MFTFDGDYDNFTQVEPFLDEFLAVFEEVKRGNMAYNDDFRGRIPGIANTEKRGPNVGTHEDAAIYMLQGLKRQREQEAKIAALTGDGYERLDTLTVRERFEHVVLYPLRRFGGEWAEFRDARVLPDDDGKPHGVLSKGKRTRGTLILGRGVLVKR